MRARSLALVLAASALVAAAPAVAGPAGDAKQKAAFTWLIRDTRSIPSRGRDKRDRAALLRAVRRARAASASKPCTAGRLLRAYRALLPRISARRSLGGQRVRFGGQPGPASLRGTLAAEALEAEGVLKAAPGTASCGGVPSAAAGEVGTTILKSDERQLTLRVRLPEPRFTSRRGRGVDYTELFVDSMQPMSAALGHPAVPVASPTFAIPAGATPSVQVIGASTYTLEDVNLLPLQPQPVDASAPPDPSVFADKPFVVSPDAYKSNKPVPERLADTKPLGRMRDLNIGGLQLAAAQYRP